MVIIDVDVDLVVVVIVQIIVILDDVFIVFMISDEPWDVDFPTTSMLMIFLWIIRVKIDVI